MKAAVLALVSGLALAGSASALVQAYDWGDTRDAWAKDAEFADTKALCRQVKTTPFPLADRAAPMEFLKAESGRGVVFKSESLKGCDAEALYYGIGMKPDPARARQCAYSQLGAKGDGAGFGPKTILMTVYANGRGAERDLDLAIRLACSLEAAPAEYDARIGHLADLKKLAAKPAKPFDFCDDITSGLAGGQCAAHQKAIDDARRKARIEVLAQRWTTQQKQAFSVLEKAKTDFFVARGGEEIESAGAARQAFQIEELQRREDLFQAFLERLEKGQGIKSTRSDFQAADRDINLVYRQIQERRDLDNGAVTRSNIQDVQRLWTIYRDAWMAFAKVRYPDVPQDAVAATLTLERISMLRKFST